MYIDIYSVCTRFRELCRFIRTSVQIRMYSVHMYCSIVRTVFSVSASAGRCVHNKCYT